MSFKPKPGQMTPFNAPAGTVWRWKDKYMSEDLYVVLDLYQDNVKEQHPETVFRFYLDLLTNEISYFADESHYNWHSERLA